MTGPRRGETVDGELDVLQAAHAQWLPCSAALPGRQMRLTTFSDYALRVLMYAGTMDDRLVTIEEVASATTFLLDHPSVNGVNLHIDGGWLVT